MRSDRCVKRKCKIICNGPEDWLFYEETMTQFTKEGGDAMQRNTSQRQAIERVFNEQDRPLKIEEVLAHGREIVGTLNQATVYRNLKLMVENGWLKHINHPSIGTLYERAEKEHHHHFHCHECDRVYEVPGCALKHEDAVPDGFVMEEHEVFLSGVCRSCAGSEA